MTFVFTSVVLVTTIEVLVSYSKLIEWLLRCSLVSYSFMRLLLILVG